MRERAKERSALDGRLRSRSDLTFSHALAAWSRNHRVHGGSSLGGPAASTVRRVRLVRRHVTLPRAADLREVSAAPPPRSLAEIPRLHLERFDPQIRDVDIARLAPEPVPVPLAGIRPSRLAERRRRVLPATGKADRVCSRGAVRRKERESPRAQLGDVGGDARSSHCGQAANDQRNSLGSASSGSKLTQGLLQGILTLNSFGPTCRIGWRWPEVLQPVERIFDTPMQLIEGAC